MSGILWSSFRKGNRAELLADFLLSSIGICTPVRRQDDLGFDFHCQLGDENKDGYITFKNPFIIQIKSNLDRGILYGSTEADKWRHEGISWLFDNKTPFFIGVIDLDKASLAIYDTTGLWQVYNKKGFWSSQIELRSKPHPEGEMRENVESKPLVGWMEGKGDGFKHIVDLGNPLIEFSYQDLNSRALMDGKKALLSNIISIEQKNIVNRDLGIRVFTEIKSNNPPGYGFGFGKTFAPHQDLHVDAVLKELHDGLISVLIKLKDEGKTDACNALKEFLKFAPRTRADSTLYRADPDLFDYLAPDEQ